jgi:hypothetical protein
MLQERNAPVGRNRLPLRSIRRINDLDPRAVNLLPARRHESGAPPPHG